MPQPAAFPLSGAVSHVDASGFTVSDGMETITIAPGSSSFAFSKPLVDGSAYTITITAQPAGGHCVVSNATGTIKGAAVTSPAIACNTMISTPLVLGVVPVAPSQNIAARIFLPVTQVGSSPTKINAIFDTGSSGTLLKATDIFPKSIVTSGGFIFPAGKTSIEYNGVVVTNVVATRTYGGAQDRTVLTGNLGFAQMTFGAGTHATTAMTPILLVFSRTRNGTLDLDGTFGNVFGVNPQIAPIIVAEATPPTPAPPCALSSTTSCGLASPFRYLDYADGIDKGFILRPVVLSACDITAGGCTSAPNLSIGVSANDLQGFSTFALPECGTSIIYEMKSEPVCLQAIPNVVVSSGASSFTGPMIFDTGTPSTSLMVPAGMAFPQSLPSGTTLRITTPSSFAYQFTTASGYLNTTVQQRSSNVSNSGIAYFTLNAFAFDYTSALVGWRGSY